jgi:Asp-tRNA(Asn)/Glu-tRNA(Gln) amidotransferase A subunit family amidase
VIDDIRDHSLEELAGFVRARRVSAEELVRFALGRIEALNRPLNAWAVVDGERAIRDAQLVDAGIAAGDDVGPLAGIPIGVKDIEDAEGFRTGYGSVMHADDPPARADSVLTARLRRAGCVVVGKTTTPEHGWGADTQSIHWGITRNPWNLERTPGGSSGGTAVALATGMVPLATGSDGGGSIRIPAALCGLSAIKTTNGLIPLGGRNPPGAGVLSVRGPMTRRIADAAYALQVCVGADPTDVFSVATPPTSWTELNARLPGRVIWAPAPGFQVDAEIARVCAEAVARLEAEGTEVVVVDELFQSRPVEDWFVLWSVMRERAQGHLRATADWERIDPGLREQMNYARWYVDAPTFMKAMDGIHRANLDLAHHFEQAAIILLPTVAGQTPVSGNWGTVNSEEWPYWVAFPPVFNMTRHPAGTLCAGYTSDGMPVGLQVVAERFRDLAVLQTIHAFERMLDDDRRPTAHLDVDPLT